MMTSVEEMIGQYVSAWNENSLDSYEKEFSRCWAPNGIYVDPYSECNGLAGLSAFAYKSLEIVPEREFGILEQPEYHHGFGRYAWKVQVCDQTNTGYDYFEFSANIEITRLVSFFKLPAD